MLAWNWLRFHSVAQGPLHSAAQWSMIGYMFLFTAAWFGCGIGGPPGNMLSADVAAQNQSVAIGAAMLSIFFSVPGWACVLVGQGRLFAAQLHRE